MNRSHIPGQVDCMCATCATAHYGKRRGRELGRALDALAEWPTITNVYICCNCDAIMAYPKGGRCIACKSDALSNLTPLLTGWAPRRLPGRSSEEAA